MISYYKDLSFKVSEMQVASTDRKQKTPEGHSGASFQY
jgi:hypothetical protein